MYSRPPDQQRSKLRIPDNYNGNAFSGINNFSSRYADLKEDNSVSPPPFGDLTAPTQAEPDPTYKSIAEPDISDAPEENEVISASATQREKKSSPLASLLPSFVGSSAHFPFGHGIGNEELLILAMMAMIFTSEGETDNELLLLLGLLLFAG